MIFLDFIFWGWYQILDKSIYLNKVETHGIGPKEHSFFITFLLHGINIWTVLRYLFIEYLGVTVNLYLSLLIALAIFGIGYLIFFKGKRANTIISSEMNNFKALISIILTLAYTAISIYLMLEVGNYIRNKLHPDLM